jgi:hypothetical protein
MAQGRSGNAYTDTYVLGHADNESSAMLKPGSTDFLGDRHDDVHGARLGPSGQSSPMTGETWLGAPDQSHSIQSG